jgi:hypothetical protein
MNQYPIELVRPPVHVIALLYMSEYHEKVSKCLSEVFDSINVLTFPNEISLPPKKTRKSFDGYKPIGLMKRNWMKKHQEIIPSVIIMLVEWKPEQSNWKEQEQSIAAQVDKIKRRASGRNTKFLLLVITKTKPKDITVTIQTSETDIETETLKVDDFYSNIKKSCNMDNSKQVQQFEEQELQSSSLIYGKIGKMLQELSTQYYKEQATKTKKLKSEANPVLQPYLFVRHRFKVAFYSEISFRGFTQASNTLAPAQNQKIVKYLLQSYSYLAAINTKDHGIGENEIKTVGDIINFKICQMKLLEKKTVDQAVKQFMKHIHWYKQMTNEIKKQGLLFKHYAMVYRQYRTFGEMLEALPQNHLKREDSYQNPGFYFKTAASLAKLRRSSFMSQFEGFIQPIETLLRNNTQIIEDLKKDDEACYEGYYGQQIEMDPQVFFSQQMNETGISLKDVPRKQIFRDVAKEVLIVKHSEDIIQMLTKAYNNYKKYHTLKRLIYSIASNIAEEHYLCKQWDRAKQFFDKISKTYKKEQWYELLTSVKRLSLVCAKELNNPKDYVINLLELISTKLEVTEQERINFWNELLSFLNGTAETKIAPLPADSPLMIEVDKKNVLLSLRVQFGMPFVCVHEPVMLNLQFTCYSPQPMNFKKLSVQFKKRAYNFTLSDQQDLSTVFPYAELSPAEKLEPKKVQQTGETANTNNLNEEKEQVHTSHILDLTLRPNGATTLFSFPIIIKEKQEFECDSVNLYLIGQTGQQICFQWKMQDNKYYSSLLTSYDFRYEIAKDNLFIERPVIHVTEPKPKLEIKYDHQPPALINEFYPIKIILISKGDHVIGGKLQLNQIANVTPYHFIDNELKAVMPDSTIQVDGFAANSSKDVIIFLNCTVPGMIRLKSTFRYEASTYPSLYQESELDIYVQYPFDAKFTFMGTRPTGKDSFRLISSQSVSFFQKIMNNTCQNVIVNDPREQHASNHPYHYNDGFPAQQQIIMTTHFTSNTPYPILLDRVEYVPVDKSNEISCIDCCSSHVIDFEQKRLLDDKTSVPSNFGSKDYLDNRDCYSVCHVLKSNSSGRNVKTGFMNIACRRFKQLVVPDLESKVDRAFTTILYQIPLPNLNIYHRDLRATFDSPSEAVLGKPFQATLTIHNDSSVMKELQLQVTDSDALLFSGITQLNFTLLPYCQKQIVYNMVPIVTGHVVFPKFNVQVQREQVYILSEKESWSIFVYMM